MKVTDALSSLESLARVKVDRKDGDEQEGSKGRIIV